MENTISPLRLVIPRSMRDYVLRMCHDHPTAGHLGNHKTYHRIRDRYWWKGLRKDIREYVRTCGDCQSRKTQMTRPVGLLQPIKVGARWQMVAMDIMGPLLNTLGHRCTTPGDIIHHYSQGVRSGEQLYVAGILSLPQHVWDRTSTDHTGTSTNGRAC